MKSSRSSRDWKFLVVAIFAALCALVSVYNLMLSAEVRELQANVAARQQFINESVPLARVNTQIIQTLANMSAQSNDTAIRDMLARHGVTFSSPEPDPADADQTQ